MLTLKANPPCSAWLVARKADRKLGERADHAVHLDRAAELASRHGQGWPDGPGATLPHALIRGIEPIAEQVEKDARHLLWRDLDWVQALGVVAFQSDVEALVLSAGAVIGEVQGFLD